MACVPCYQVCEKCTESQCSQFSAIPCDWGGFIIPWDSKGCVDCTCNCHTCSNCKFTYFAYENHDSCHLCDKCGKYEPYANWVTPTHCRPCVDCGIRSKDAAYSRNHRCIGCSYTYRRLEKAEKEALKAEKKAKRLAEKAEKDAAKKASKKTAQKSLS